MIDTRICGNCHAKKKTSEFHIRKDGSVGRRCKRCTQKFKDYKLKNRDRINELARIYYHRPDNEKQRLRNLKERNKEFATPNKRFYQYRYSAKQRGVMFEISFDEFMSFWQSDCVYCGDPISTIGLDRIDSKIGYYKDNLISCCSICNYMKQEFNKEMFLEHCFKISKRQALLDFAKNKQE